MVRDLSCDMLNNRFSDLALDPNASFIRAYCLYGETVKKMDAFEVIVIPKEGRETDAFNDIIFQLEKMHRYGFTNAELERAKNDKLNAMEKLYNESNPEPRKHDDIQWNFTKFLIDREGKVVARFEPTLDMKEVEAQVEALL